MKQFRIHPLLSDIVQSGILACDGVVFDNRDACPACGGNLTGYDTKKKQFAVIQEGDRPHSVHVLVKRFSCRQCGTVCFADEPYYPGIRIGSPAVDLCITLAAIMPYHRAAAYMSHMGIVIDRGTVRNYASGLFPEIPTTDLFGIHLPLSVVSLSTIAAHANEGTRIIGTEVLAACGFPSAYRAAPDRLFPLKQGNEREEEENKKERQAYHP